MQSFQISKMVDQNVKRLLLDWRVSGWFSCCFEVYTELLLAQVMIYCMSFISEPANGLETSFLYFIKSQILP